MPKSPIFHGAKAILIIDNKIVGIFTQCSYGVNLDVHTAHILGRHGVAQFTYTGMDAVRVSLSGFRVINTGVYAINIAPELKELMTTEGIQIQIVDRETDATIMRVENCHLTDWSSGQSARSISDVSMSLVGQKFSDETTDGAEAPRAVSITDGSPSNEE